MRIVGFGGEEGGVCGEGYFGGGYGLSLLLIKLLKG